MGLTDKGYIRSTYDDILKDTIQFAKELFGEDIDTSDQGWFGKILCIIAYNRAITEENNEAVYFARNPATASGHSLDNLLWMGGITRNPATAAAYSVIAYGTAGYTIPVGFLVGTDTDIMFWTTQEYTIGADGSVLMEVSCTETGSVGNVSAPTINRIINPDANVTVVEGTECLMAGADMESDVDLRQRLTAAIAGAGSCNEAAIRAALLRVPTVQYAAVISNNSDTTDAEGRPAHSFECYVLGGDDYEQEIAEAIFAKRPIGIQTHGDKTVTITDVSGLPRTVSFSAVPTVNITIRARIRTSSAFPADGIAQIQAAVAAYINALGIGNSLILSTLYGRIYGVVGVQEVTTLESSTDGGGSYSAASITVPAHGVAVCSAVNVEVGA